MDLPALEVMAERAMAKTMIQKQELLLKMAEIIRLLDETAKANAIKGVAGMRSYFYWANTYKQGQDLLQSIYPKVLYKLSTDSDELAILEQALSDSGLLLELQDILRKENGVILNLSIQKEEPLAPKKQMNETSLKMLKKFCA